MKVPSEFTTKPLSSYRTADTEAVPSITNNQEIVLSTQYRYFDEKDNENVLDMKYTPTLPSDFSIDAEITQEQLIRKLNTFNI